MPGLFGSLNMASEAVQVHSRGIEVTGHNIANVNNPAYARQRLNVVTAPSVLGPVGPMGNGVRAEGVQQLRDSLLDGQVRTQMSVGGYLEAQEKALDNGQAILGQEIDRQAGVGGGQNALAEGLSGLFTQFSKLTAGPEDEIVRNDLLQTAQDLALEFNRVDRRLSELRSGLDTELNQEVSRANELISAIARSNDAIFKMENGTGTANDLRDIRQQRLEELSKLTDLATVTNANGTVDVVIGGQTVVSGVQVADTLETFTSGTTLLVRTQTGGAPLALTGGTMQGTIDARDGVLVDLQSGINQLAGTLITLVNDAHRPGYSLDGATGRDFFTGTNASDIGVSATLRVDPRAVQASDASGEVGNNGIALALSNLGNAALFNGQSFTQGYSTIIGNFGASLASVTSQLEDQELVDGLLQRQRDSVMGVSLDEEMTNMIQFQRAFEASAKLISTLDEMLVTLVNMKR